MAVHFNGTDGNVNVTLAGAWNAGGPVASGTYTPAFAGATAFTAVFTILPDTGSLVAGNNIADRALMHCGARGGASNIFRIQHVGPTTRQVYFRVYDSSGTARTATSTAPVLTEGGTARLCFRWQASPEKMQITLNGVDVPVTLSGTAIAALSANAMANNAPLELGAMSGADDCCVAGTYQQWAISSQFASDADVAAYGATGDPGAMSVLWKYWVTLAAVSVTPIDAENAYPPGPSPQIGHLRDATNNFDYSTPTAVYNYGNGNFSMPFNGVFSQFTVVADLTTIVSPPPPPPIPTTPPAEPTWYQDLRKLPQASRRLDSWEIAGELGPRRSTIAVASGGNVQTAMNAALPGDDILVDHTATFTLSGPLIPPAPGTIDSSTLRVLPRGNTPITGSVTVAGTTPITGATPITVSGDPAYIRVMTDDRVSLPGIAPRAITDGGAVVDTVYDAPDGTSCGVLASHASAMPTFSCTTSDSFVAIGPNYTAGKRRYWYFHGLKAQWPTGTAVALNMQGVRGTNSLITPEYGPDPTAPDHILFNQCLFDPDPTKMGYGGAQLAKFEGDFLGVLNSLADNFYATGGGENNLTLTMGDSLGPAGLLNTEIPLIMTQSWFSGGGSTNRVGVQMQDNFWIRNWQYVPSTWRLDAVNPVQNPWIGGSGATSTTGGWRVSFDSATVIRYVSGRSEDQGSGASFPGTASGWRLRIGSGCIVYEIATGRARKIINAPEYPGSVSKTLQLEAAWPGSDPTGTTIGPVYFQFPFPNVLYNSGMDDVNHGGTIPTATFTNGSTAVTFSHALPATCRVGHFIYPNNTWWDGGITPSQPEVMPDDTHVGTHHNGYGHLEGITYANCKRKKIVAIAGDRLSCTLENAFITSSGDADPLTFPFSIVLCDGLFRPAHAAGKGAWETKCSASRMLWRGNVAEVTLGSGTLHNVQNPYFYNNLGGATYTVATTSDGDVATISSSADFGGRIGAIVGHRRTFNPRGWPYNGAETVYPYAVLTKVNNFNNDDFWSVARVISHYVDPTHLVLEPLNGALRPTATYTAPQSTPIANSPAITGSPWWTVQGFTYDYNLHIGVTGGTSCMIGLNEESGEMTKGKWANFAHNVYLLMGHPSANYPMIIGALNMPSTADGGGITGFGTFVTCQGQTTQDQSWTRFSHNSLVRVTVPATGIGKFFDVGTTAAFKAHDVDLSDNLAVGFDAGTMHVLASGTGNPVDPVNVWTLDSTCRVRRSVFVGSHAATAVTTLATRFPDNVSVATPAAAGLAAYGSQTNDEVAAGIVTGDIDPTDFSPYALTGTYANTATDGTNPGANLALAEQYVRNVRRHAV